MSMSSAGRAENSNGCVTRPKGREIGLSGFAAQIQLYSLTGSYVMATAEHREPYESRGSRTVLGARGGEIPPRDSTIESNHNACYVRSSFNCCRDAAVPRFVEKYFRTHAVQQTDAIG